MLSCCDGVREDFLTQEGSSLVLSLFRRTRDMYQDLQTSLASGCPEGRTSDLDPDLQECCVLSGQLLEHLCLLLQTLANEQESVQGGNAILGALD